MPIWSLSGGGAVNLFTDAFADRLIQLWKQNRPEVYDRETVASAEQADAMVSLADAVHRYVLNFTPVNHEGVCIQ